MSRSVLKDTAGAPDSFNNQILLFTVIALHGTYLIDIASLFSRWIPTLSCLSLCGV
ncbi:unnamed protein product [Arabidopsis halleri]